MHKVDLHTHSTASVDGGIKPDQYRHLLEVGVLDCIAITDHNRIDMAVSLSRDLGDKIIVGEEITTTGGDIIGLFLQSPISPNLAPVETVKIIKQQGGFVYIPHPFEMVRSGLTEHTLDEIIEYVDIIEVYNGRAIFQNRGPQAVAWAKLHQKLRAASSDAHGLKGVGSAYTTTEHLPKKENFLEVLGKGHLISSRPPFVSLFSPKANRLRKRFRNEHA